MTTGTATTALYTGEERRKRKLSLRLPKQAKYLQNDL